MTHHRRFPTLLSYEKDPFSTMLDKYDALIEANPYAQLNYRGVQHLAMMVNFRWHPVKKQRKKTSLSDRYSTIALLLNKFPQKEQDTWEKRSTTKNKQRKQESGCGAENPRQNKLLDHNALLLYLLMVGMVWPDGRRSSKPEHAMKAGWHHLNSAASNHHFLSLLFGGYCRICSSNIFEQQDGMALQRSFRSRCRGSKPVKECNPQYIAPSDRYGERDWKRDWPICFDMVQALV